MKALKLLVKSYNGSGGLEMSYDKVKLIILSVFVISVYAVDSFSESTATLLNRKIYKDQEAHQIIQDNLLDTVDRLIAQNSPDLDGVDLQKLKSSIPSINWYVYSGEPLVGSGIRSDAVNLPEQRIVLLNYENTKVFSSIQMSLIQWHEAYGALGYNDENILLSVITVLKANNPDFKLSSSLKKNFQKQFNEPIISQNKIYIAAGGATSVGGGGNGKTAEVKMILLMLLNKIALAQKDENTQQTEKLMSLLVDTPIESNEFESQYLHLINNGRLSIGINKFNGKISILIDPKEWEPLAKNILPLSNKNLELVTQIANVLRYLQ